MSVERTYAFRAGSGRNEAGSGPEPSALLAAVREDIRQTLRTGWIDPALDAASVSPAFFEAGWSAIRPNVGKSFLLLVRALRAEAVDSVRTILDPPDLRKQLAAELAEEELRRVEESVRAAHLATAKIQVVVHALTRAARRERIGGTGREEPPVRRGVPEWQRWMSFLPAPEASRPILEEVAGLEPAVGSPATLRLLARWPAALSTLWTEMKPNVGTENWRAASNRLRRIVLAGIKTLPHSVELQWTALRSKGFTEDERDRLAEVLASHDAAMPVHTLAAAFAWVSLGSPEIGTEG